ncbi:hypothetical protein [Jiulongibacter sp. NS-SX5]|uniref:hypothetical protein n=1 Tax=Jiulongibacter sp. NS-SX5 TaxID=3463854 RepID=UPI004058B48F
MVDKVLVREYLSSLKEDRELDKIIIPLLESMNYQILRTAKDTKGIPQYGRDIIARGEDSNGIDTLWLIEVKGYNQRDINSKNFASEDGIRESLIESKDALINFVGKEGLKELPRKYILAHNGITDEKFKPVFEGFICNTFKKGEFEDWDIHILSQLFSEHLFSSYLFANPENEKLFKRLLVFLDTPEYDFRELYHLYDNLKEQFRKNKKYRNTRKFLNFFSTVNLIMQMTWHYSEEEKDLNPAKHVIDFLILNTWALILEERKEKNKKFLTQFNRLLENQFKFLSAYYRKTIEVATSPRGLFNSKEFIFEQIGYSIRSYDYVDFLTYFYQLNNGFLGDNEATLNLRKQKDSIKKLIQNNKEGFHQIVFDRQIIPLHHIFSFFLLSYNNTGDDDISKDDLLFLMELLVQIFDQFFIRKQVKGGFIYSSHDLTKLIEKEYKQTKIDNYPDKQSLMLPILLEYLAIFDMHYTLKDLDNLLDGIDLQVVRPNFKKYPDLEVLMFKKNLEMENFIEIIQLNGYDSREIINSRRNATRDNYTFRTAQAGYQFLITLAQSFYKNEPYPEEWREWFDRINIQYDDK